MCVCVWKLQDEETLDSRKLLGLRGTLFLVSVIGLCFVVLCLCTFDTQTDVRKCMKHERHGNSGRKKITLAEGNPPLCLCDWILSFVTLFCNFATQEESPFFCFFVFAMNKEDDERSFSIERN